MDITVMTLIYKSPAYLDFVMNSLIDHPSEKHKVKYLIVSNDATEEVVAAAEEWSHYPNVRHIEHRSEDPNEWYIQRVYKAYNRGISECDTQYISMVNSDMAFTNGWLDKLAKYDTSKCIPTSRLVESGRMPSLHGLISRNFGQTLGTFDKDGFEKFASEVSKDEFAIGVGAYGPNLFNKDHLDGIGGLQLNRGNTPGDRITFEMLRSKYGLQHIMVMDSIVYHFQRGESAEVGDYA